MNMKIAIILGSETDRETMEAGNKYYDYFGTEITIDFHYILFRPNIISNCARSALGNFCYIIPVPK